MRALLFMMVSLALAVSMLHADRAQARDVAKAKLKPHFKKGYVHISSQKRGNIELEGKTSFSTTLIKKQDYLLIAAGDKKLSKFEVIVLSTSGELKVLRKATSYKGVVEMKWSQTKTERTTFLLRALSGRGDYHSYLVVKKAEKK